MVRFPSLFAFVLVLASGCTGETFELLPPPADQASGGMQGGTGGSAGGTSGSGGAGRGGQSGTGGERPDADCPDGVRDCRACASSLECRPGEVCDPTRNYCAPYCSSSDYCPPDRRLCDTFTHVCVQCQTPTHCGGMGWDCDRGACEIPPCSESQACPYLFPVCDHGTCRGCFDNQDCSPGMKCNQGLCVPG
ncbi:MAG TPA: hypothetical protein VFV94_02405 [Polyangiaceae bacterium]|nr:hypothetical protein [Polyangiaceae bacterium]